MTETKGEARIPAPPMIREEAAMCRGERCIHGLWAGRAVVVYYEPATLCAAFYDIEAGRWTLTGPVTFALLVKSFPERGVVLDERALPGWIDACSEAPDEARGLH